MDHSTDGRHGLIEMMSMDGADPEHNYILRAHNQMDHSKMVGMICLRMAECRYGCPSDQMAGFSETDNLLSPLVDIKNIFDERLPKLNDSGCWSSKFARNCLYVRGFEKHIRYNLDDEPPYHNRIGYRHGKFAHRHFTVPYLGYGNIKVFRYEKSGVALEIR